MNSVQEENETDNSNVHGHAQLNESNGFHPTVKAENKEDLGYDAEQELKKRKEEVKQNLNSVLEEDEIAGSHANTYEQSRESVSFQHATKSKSRKDLFYDDNQE